MVLESKWANDEPFKPQSSNQSRNLDASPVKLGDYWETIPNNQPLKSKWADDPTDEPVVLSDKWETVTKNEPLKSRWADDEPDLTVKNEKPSVKENHETRKNIHRNAREKSLDFASNKPTDHFKAKSYRNDKFSPNQKTKHYQKENSIDHRKPLDRHDELVRPQKHIDHNETSMNRQKSTNYSDILLNRPQHLDHSDKARDRQNRIGHIETSNDRRNESLTPRQSNFRSDNNSSRNEYKSNDREYKSNPRKNAKDFNRHDDTQRRSDKTESSDEDENLPDITDAGREFAKRLGISLDLNDKKWDKRNEGWGGRDRRKDQGFNKPSESKFSKDKPKKSLQQSKPAKSSQQQQQQKQQLQQEQQQSEDDLLKEQEARAFLESLENDVDWAEYED